MNQKEIDDLINELPEVQRREYLNLVEQLNTVLHGASMTAKLLAFSVVGEQLLVENEDKESRK